MEQLIVKSLTGKTTIVDIEAGEKVLITPAKVTVRAATGKTTTLDVDSGDSVTYVWEEGTQEHPGDRAGQ